MISLHGLEGLGFRVQGLGCNRNIRSKMLRAITVFRVVQSSSSNKSNMNNHHS